jgi:hypothetical protein
VGVVITNQFIKTSLCQFSLLTVRSRHSGDTSKRVYNYFRIGLRYFLSRNFRSIGIACFVSSFSSSISFPLFSTFLPLLSLTRSFYLILDENMFVMSIIVEIFELHYSPFEHTSSLFFIFTFENNTLLEELGSLDDSLSKYSSILFCVNNAL